MLYCNYGNVTDNDTETVTGTKHIKFKYQSDSTRKYYHTKKEREEKL